MNNYLPSILMLLGVSATAYLGYLGSKRQAESNIINMTSKADKSLVDEMKLEIHELQKKIEDLIFKLKMSEAARDTLQKENVELMRQLLHKN